MAFVTTLHLQVSADAALSCKPGRPVTKGGHKNGEYWGVSGMRDDWVLGVPKRGY